MKKRSIVSRSSAKVEYWSMTITLCEIKLLHRLLIDLQAPMHHSIPLHCNNLAAIYITANPIFDERTTHIEIDDHFVHDAFLAHLVAPAYIPSNLQLQPFS